MSPAGLEALGFEVERERCRAVARMAMLSYRVGLSGSHLVDGHRTVRAWLMAATNMSTGEAARLVRVGRMLARFPSAEALATDGQLGVAQMDALARLCENPRVQEWLALPETEALLVGQALQLAAGDYAVFLARWEASADSDGAHDRHERAHRERRANLTLTGERMYLDASGGVPAGASMKEVLDAYVRAEWQAEWDAGVARYGEAMHLGLMTRTDTQRRFDALAAVFAAATQQAQGGVGGPLVNIVVDWDTFVAEATRMAGGEPEAANPNRPHRCDTPGGTPVDPADMLVAAMMGQVRRVVLDSAGVVVDVGRRQRCFTGPVRDAILLTARTCVWPGCSRPATACEVDHAIPWAHAGPTDAANAAPACAHHNRWRTRGYRTWRDADGHWHHLRPDHTEVGWRAARVASNDLFATAGG